MHYYQVQKLLAMFDVEMHLSTHVLVGARGRTSALEKTSKTKSDSLFGMTLVQLHDTSRNVAYERAIKWALQGRPHARVVEIGAGSGLLSIIAAHAGASHVLAYEMVRAVAAVAMVNVRWNNVSDRVRIVAGRSNSAAQQMVESERYGFTAFCPSH
jgi:tRNA/tmRNA/rRNA uracil-C5-methylase (TrmA/RlmC/RlmD family)